MTAAADACYREAREAWRAGMSPVPCGKPKQPVTAWKDMQRRRPTADQLREWYPGRESIGIVCGPKPDDPDQRVAAMPGVECIDFDGRETYDTMKAEAAHVGLADLIATIESAYVDDTPGGGVRWLYRCPEVPGNMKLAQRLGEDGLPQVVIETRGAGGFCVVAPSGPSAHPSGKPYVRRSGGFAGIVTLTVEQRAQIIAFMMSFDQVVKPASTSSSSRTSSDGTRPGDDYNSRTTWPEILEPHGWTAMYARRDGVTCWRRPGKSTPGLSATTGYAGSDMLCVFTSSSVFDAGRSYDKFGAFAVLEHAGDYGAAARALAQHGYGAPTPGHTAPPQAARSTAPTTPWPEPLSSAAYHGILGDIVRAVEPETEGDPAGILLTLVVMVGNMIGRTVHFRVGGETHYPNLYAGIVGKTSKGRKGVGLGVSRLILRDVDPAWYALQAAGLNSGEGLIHAVRDETTSQKPIKIGGVVADYETVVADPGVADKRLMVVETELASVLRRMTREGNSLSAVLRQGWDGHSLRTMSKAAPETATDPHVSVVAHITRDELRRYLDSTETANGLANRFLWVCVQRQRELPDGGDLPDLDVFRSRLTDVAAWCRVYGGGELSRDDEARALWHHVYGRLTRERPGLLGAVTGRAEAQVMRLAVIYAACDRSEVIGAVHLRAALAVWRYCLASAGYVFGDALGDPVADDLLRELRLVAPNPLTRTEITQAFGRNRTANEITRAIQMLVDADMATVEHVHSGGRGRPQELVRLKTHEENELNRNTPKNPQNHADQPREENEVNSPAPGFTSFNAQPENTQNQHKTGANVNSSFTSCDSQDLEEKAANDVA